MRPTPQAPSEHPFLRSPHATLFSLSFPVLLSLIAEPLTGIVDTAFIVRLGAAPLAALGVGTVALSSLFWIFNFLGISTQTQVAQAEGRQDQTHAAQVHVLATGLSGISGIIILISGFFSSSAIASVLGASGVVHSDAELYLSIRWFGAPAVLVMMTAFGTLRGLQDMKSPLWIAIGVNALNIGLDAVLIYGAGPVPAYGIAGAAVASIVSQWLGAVWALIVVYNRLGMPDHLDYRHARTLLVTGGDLFIRTGLLNAFLLLTTRAATRSGVENAAAHQAIRQVWTLSTLVLDAYAVTGQSLVAYFIGPERRSTARRVASVVCTWGVITGVVLGAVMWAGQGLVIRFLVPPRAVEVFLSAWILAVLVQPINALAFTTDGIHWGTGDFRYLRNAVMAATLIGAVGILFLDEHRPDALAGIWVISSVWISIRALFGVVRIWPGIGRSPLGL